MNTAVRENEVSRSNDIFISYSRKDKEFVRRLNEALQTRGREPWVDWEDIRPAEEFMQAIYAAIESANAIVFVLSPNSIGSGVCGRELAHAAEQNKRLIPVLVQEVDESKVPEALAKLNWIMCREGDDFEAEIDKLIQALDTDLEWVRQHSRLLVRAVEWETRGKNNSFVLRGDDLHEAESWLTEAATDKNRQPTALQTEYIIASRKAVARTQRKMLGAVTFGAVIAVVLAVLALLARNRANIEKHNAEAAAKRATRARVSAEKLVGYMVTDLREKLEPLGQLRFLDDVNRGVKAYFDSVAKEDETPENLRQRSLMSNNYGGVLLAQGDIRAALASYRTGLAITEELLKSNPRDLDRQFDVAKSHSWIAAALQTQGSLPEALKEFRVAQQLLNALVQHDPPNSSWQEVLSNCDNGIGDIQNSQGDLDGALKSYLQGLAITEKLLQQAPANVLWLRNLSLSNKRIAGVRSAQGDFPGALKSCRDSLAISQKLADEDPDNAQQRFELAASHGLVGTTLQAQGMRAEALEEYRVYKEIMEGLARRDPANARWQRELSVTYNKLGDMQSAQGDVEGALKSYRDNLVMAEALVRRDPENADWQRDLGVSYNKIGDGLTAQNKFGEAIEYYRRGLTIAEPLTKRDAGHTLWQRDLSFSYQKLGFAQVKQQDLRAALGSYRQSLAVLEKLAALYPENASWDGDLFWIYWNTGRTLSQVDPAARIEARTLIEKASEKMLRIRERLGSTAEMQNWSVAIETELRRLRQEH